MPSWKRVLTSGSDAQLNSVYVPGPTINQLTASVAITALNTYNSTALNSGTVQRIDSASVTWSIQHNLNEFWPIVYVWQEDPDYVYTPVITDQIKVISQNSIEITFPTASRGYVNVSRAGHIVSGSVPWTNLIGDANVTASLNIYGNVIANQGFTGSLWGTSSWSTSSISASYSDSASMALSASWAISASRSISSSFAISSSYVLTASYVNELTQKVGITGSIDISGSSYFNGKLYVNTNGVTFPISTNTPSGSSGKSLYIGSGGDSTVTDSIYTNYGSNNIGIGSSALNSVTFGYSNTAIGNNALPSLTTGSNNIAIGDTSLANLTTGTGNIAIGALAGNLAGAANLTSNINCIYIGNDVRGGSPNGRTNEIVIGAGGRGMGSNTMVLGNTSSFYYFPGFNVGIGLSTVPTSKLHVSGSNAGRIAHFFSSNAPNAFIVSGSGNIGLGVSSPNANLVVSGSTIISGSLTVLGGITGSLFGTSSWSENVVSSSYAYTASSAISSSFSNTSISASWAISASRAISSVSSSYAYTASSAISASYAETASYASNITITGSIFGVDYIDFDTGSTFVSSVGRLGWDSGENNLQVGMYGGNVQYAVGEQIYQYVYNAESTSITKGQVVYVSGSQGNRIAAKLASNNADRDSASTLGFVAETITAGGTGWIITEGTLRKINTVGLTAGASIYLSATPGAYTQTPTTAPSHSVRLGYVERVNATVGSIYVKIDNGYEIGELHDIVDTTTTSSYGQLMVKNGSVWVTTNQLTGSYGITGSLTANSFTGSLFGTSSWSNNSISSSYSYTASSAISASYAFTASSAISSSFAQNTISASYAFTASSAISSSWTVSSSRAISSISASYAYTASSAVSASYSYTASLAISSSWAVSSSRAISSVSASYSYTASSAESSSYAYTASSAISASWSVSSSRAIASLSASYAYTASSAVSASIALTASFLSGSVSSASYAYTASSAISSSFSSNTISSSYAYTASSAVSASWAISSSRSISSISASYSYTASSAVSSSISISSSYSVSSSQAISASWAPMNISGSNNYIALWSGSTNISSSILYQSGSNIGINKTNPTTTLDVNGNTTLSGSLSVSGSVTTYIPPKIISSSYTLTIQDAGRFTEVSSSAAVVITIPADSSVDYPIGAQTMFAAFTTSSVSFTTGSNSVTLRSSGNRLKLLQQYSGATLVKRAANDWYIFGDMTL